MVCLSMKGKMARQEMGSRTPRNRKWDKSPQSWGVLVVQSYARKLLRDEPLGQRPRILLGEMEKWELEIWKGLE